MSSSEIASSNAYTRTTLEHATENLPGIQTTQSPAACFQDSEGIPAHLLREVASPIGGVKDLIVKHREIKRQTQADGVCWRKLKECDVLHAKV